MPIAAPRKCTLFGCHQTAVDGTGRCEDHQRPKWVKRHEQTKRITGRRLQKMRADLFRENPFCVECKKNGYLVPATQRDHKVPLAEGGADDSSNDQGLCDECHAIKSKQEAKRFRHREFK